MEDIVYEVIGGAIVLALAVMVITVFSASGDTVKKATTERGSAENISLGETFGTSGSVYGGPEIKAVVSYVQDFKGLVEIDGVMRQIKVVSTVGAVHPIAPFAGKDMNNVGCSYDTMIQRLLVDGYKYKLNIYVDGTGDVVYQYTRQ